jgi:hypothetical protein
LISLSLSMLNEEDVLTGGGMYPPCSMIRDMKSPL